jgi:hypothetical protein
MTLNAAIELIKKAKNAEANHFEKLRDERSEVKEEPKDDAEMEGQDAEVELVTMTWEPAIETNDILP